MLLEVRPFQGQTDSPSAIRGRRETLAHGYLINPPSGIGRFLSSIRGRRETLDHGYLIHPFQGWGIHPLGDGHHCPGNIDVHFFRDLFGEGEAEGEGFAALSAASGWIVSW